MCTLNVLSTGLRAATETPGQTPFDCQGAARASHSNSWGEPGTGSRSRAGGVVASSMWGAVPQHPSKKKRAAPGMVTGFNQSLAIILKPIWVRQVQSQAKKSSQCSSGRGQRWVPKLKGSSQARRDRPPLRLQDRHPHHIYTGPETRQPNCQAGVGQCTQDPDSRRFTVETPNLNF